MLSRPVRGEQGFTLIELLVTITIISTIIFALTGVVIEYARVSNDTSARLNASTDQQFASAYWQQDVSSLGLHGFNSGQLPQQQSVWTGSAPSGVPSGCTSGLPGALVVGFAWNDYPSGSTDPVAAWTGATVDAAVYTAKQVGAQSQLWRTRCFGSGSPVSILLARHLTAAPTVGCATSSGASTACTSINPFPATVALTMQVEDLTQATNTNTGYTTTLTAERRQG